MLINLVQLVICVHFDQGTSILGQHALYYNLIDGSWLRYPTHHGQNGDLCIMTCRASRMYHDRLLFAKLKLIKTVILFECKYMHAKHYIVLLSNT